MPEIRIEHRYPLAFAFVAHYGADAIAILHDLITHSEEIDGQLIVQVSVRQIAERLPRLSKDTVHRRLRDLRRTRVLRTAPPRTTSRFQRPTYVLDLTGTGISVTRSRSTSA